MNVIIGILGLMLVAAKLFGVISWSWWLVLLPFYAGLAFLLLVGFFAGFVAVIVAGLRR